MSFLLQSYQDYDIRNTQLTVSGVFLVCQLQMAKDYTGERQTSGRVVQDVSLSHQIATRD